MHDNISNHSMKTYTKETFLQKLRQLKLPNYKDFNCINEAYLDFTQKLMAIVDKIAPMREIRVKGNTKPWFDEDIIEKINVRDKQKTKFTKSKLYVDYINLQKANAIISKKKCDYIKEEINKNIAKPSKL